MRKILLALVSVVMLFGFAGCGSHSTSTQSQVSPTSVTWLRDYDPFFKDVPTATLIHTRDGVCAAFKAGMSFNELTLSSQGSGLTAKHVGELIGWSIVSKCPQFKSYIQ